MKIIELDDSTDHRGQSFSVLAPHLDLIGGQVRDVHIGEIGPGQIRGDHFHTLRNEIIAVIYTGPWSLHWDTGAGTSAQHRRFIGRGGVAFAPPKLWSHAVRNDGDTPMWIIALSDRTYDRHHHDDISKDTIRRSVTE